MKRIFSLIIALAIFGFVIAPIVTVASQALHVSPTLIGLGIVGLSIALYPLRNRFPGVSTNDVEVEVWNQFIAENIYKNNKFLERAHNADDNVLAGAVVHIPQSGAASNVVKNRTSLPATVTKRSDTDVTYALDEFTTDPRLISNAETVELSYNKMESVMKDDMNALRQVVAENMLLNWAPSGNILRTSGATASAATLPEATGNRADLALNDFIKMMNLFNGQDAPDEGRCAMLSAAMYGQLWSAMSATQQRDFLAFGDPKTGKIGQFMTFDIYRRSTALVYNNAGTPVVKPYGSAGAATDNDTILFWHEDGVERAMGEVVTFWQGNNPQYYGDLMSFLMRMGGRIRRADGKWVGAVVQAAAA